MTDILASRLKLGVLVPSTNSSVQPELDAMRPAGVANHVARIAVPNQVFTSDADAEAIVEATWADLMPALDRVMACNPDRVLMAMAVPCFWGGVAAGDALRERLEAHAGVPVVTPPDALHAALEALGVSRRIGFISPYMPLADRHVAAWFTEKGYEVVSTEGLRAPREDQVIDIDADTQRAALLRVAGAGAEVLLQVGTSMASAHLVEPLEAETGRPVVAVNCACFWHALRTAGLDDRITGRGRLLAER